MCSGIAGAHGDALSLHSAALPQLAEHRRAPVSGGRLLHAMGKCILSEGHNWHLFYLLPWVQAARCAICWNRRRTPKRSDGMTTCGVRWS